MCKTMRRIAAGACAVFAAAAMAVTAFAEIAFPFTSCFLEGDYSDLSDSQVTITRTVGSVNNLITITHTLEGEELDLEFWNVEGGTVSCEVYLETDADVYVYMPAFANGWDWINPSTQVALVKGEWVTVSEPMQHFYDGFKKSAPYSILVQVRSTGNTEENVKATFRNFRINGVEGSVSTTATTTTTSATTTTTEATTTTTTTASSADNEPVIATEEPLPPVTEEVSAPVTDEPADPAREPTEEAVTTPAQTTTSAAVTTAVTPPATSTSIDYSQFLKEPDTTDLTATILIIVGIVVGVIALAAVGYLIYRKRKYY